MTRGAFQAATLARTVAIFRRSPDSNTADEQVSRAETQGGGETIRVLRKYKLIQPPSFCRAVAGGAPAGRASPWMTAKPTRMLRFFQTEKEDTRQVYLGGAL